MSTDPEDWPSSRDGSLCRELDRSLRCLICSEFYDTPLGLPCGHSFCATCIRSNIQYQERSGEPKCPVCRAKCEASDLKVAPQLRAAAAAYTAARSVLLAALKGSVQPNSVPPTEPQQAADRKPTPAKSSTSARPQSRHSVIAAAVGSASNGITLSSGSDTGGLEERSAKRRRCPETTGGRQGHSNGSSDPNLQTSVPKGHAFKSGRHHSAHAASDQKGPSRIPGHQSSPAVGGEENGPHSSGSMPESDGGSDDGSDPDFEMMSQPNSASDSPSSPLPPLQPRTGIGNGMDLPRGQVRCPNCGAMLPEIFVNSHLDTCLEKRSAAATNLGSSVMDATSTHMPGPAAGQSSRDPGGSKASAPSTGGGRKRKLEPLKVPPKLAFTLISDKQMRDNCKKYCLPTTGKKEAMAERYKKLRLEVQTANDAGQLGCSYTELARRVVRAENKAASAAFAPLARKGAPAAKAGSADGFQDMVKATRERHAAAKAARLATEQGAAMAAPSNSGDPHNDGHDGSAVASASCPRTYAMSASEAAPPDQLAAGAEVDSDEGSRAPRLEGSAVAAAAAAAAQDCIPHTAAGLSPATGCCGRDSSNADEQYVVCSQFQQAAGAVDDRDSPPCLSPSL